MPARAAVEYDFMIGTALFLTVYALIFTSLPTVSISFKALGDPVQTAALLLSEKLVTSPGNPKAWTSINSADELGLAFYDGRTFPNVLDAAKVSQLPAYSCTALQSKTVAAAGISVKISVENSSTSFACTGTAHPAARLVERVAYLKNGTLFLPFKLKVWAW